ncbi:MAG: YihY/virulence factor BrkB family protein [Chitinophagaceae bacterium]|nr:YihY/virulence factor BrkB family protein [Chitinophagaceae bacterium]
MTRLERIILKFAPIAFLVTKSKTLVLPGFRGLPLYDVLIFFLRQIRKVGLNERAAAISFNLIMALPAAFLFLFSLIPYFSVGKDLNKEVLRLFKDITPNTETYEFINGLLSDLLNHQHAGVFSIGFLVLIFYSSNAMMGVIRSFDRSIQEHKRKIFFHKRWRALRLTFILIILIVIATLALLLGREQLIYVLKNVFHLTQRSQRIPWWNGLRWTIIVLLLFFGVGLVYKFAPSVKKRWKLLSPGSLLATGLTLITTILFSYWVNNFSSYNKVYGSIGTVLIIMALIFINSLILLIGFELNVSIAYLTREAEERMQQDEIKLEAKVLEKISNDPAPDNPFKN